MSAISKVLRRASDADGDDQLMFWCPGCKSIHAVNLSRPADHPGPVWSWNGDAQRPTFSPSFLLRREEYWTPPVTAENLADWRRAPWPQMKAPYVCHIFVADGRIEFLADCTHHLAGQTVDMVEKWEPGQ